jgi:hypothetical protein
MSGPYSSNAPKVGFSCCSDFKFEFVLEYGVESPRCPGPRGSVFQPKEGGYLIIASGRRESGIIGNDDV